ncbi:MAG: hypothetical protein COA42_22950 [Alteromonadaceae bacterium]|nr:MAG: hypothetical protein COA42_22950 [Alteromonadaceae bacterium]
MNSKHLALLLSFSLTACASTDSDYVPNITFAPLKSAYTNYASEIDKTRPSLTFNNKSHASNCTDYFSARKKSNIVETGVNFLVAQEYLICDTLNAIKHATPTNNTSTRKNTVFDGGKQLATKVDLRSFRSSFYRRVDDL